MEIGGRVADRAGRRALLGWVAALLAWGVVLCVEVRNVENVWLLLFLLPPFEIGTWLVAGWLTVRLFGATRAARLAAAGTAVLLAALCLHFTNWAVYNPVSYYVLHRFSFAAVADGVRDGSVGTSDEYYGEPLPWRLRDLSTTGKASVHGTQDGRPIVFLPQWLGIPDDAGGYVFFDGEPRPDLEIDLYGARAHPAGGIRLGNGWWYVLPGD